MKYGIRVLAIMAVLLAGMLGMAGCGDDDVPPAVASSSVAVSDSSGSAASLSSGGSLSSGSASSGAIVSSVSSGGTASSAGGGTTFTETFTSLPLTGSSYATGSFTGVAGISWSYGNARGDQTLNGKAICLKDNLTASIPGGVGSVTFSIKKPFSDVLNCKVYVGGVQKGEAAYTADGTYTISGINVPGPATIEFRMGGMRSTIDDITITPGTPSETDRPVVSITSPSSGATLASWSLAIAGTASDPGTGASGVKSVHVSINGGAWQTADGTTDWDYDYTVTVAGALTIRAYALDNAGNCSLTNQISVTAPADTTNPEVVVNSPTEAQSITNYNVTVSGTASDSGFSAGLDGVWVQLDSATAVRASGASSWTYTFNNVPEGARTITVYAKDMAGNQSTSVVRNITVAWPPDVTAPVCTIASPAAGSQQNATGFTISGTASDSGADASGVKEVWVRLNGGTWVKATGTTSWSYVTGALGEGALSIEAKAVDNASPTGNESIVASRSVTVVTTPVFTENMSLPLAVRDYYRSAYGKTGAELKAALNSIIKSGHTRKSYDDIWDVMDDADKWNGKVILMYTGHEHNPGVRYPTWNREHTWPKSHGFPDASQYGYTDAHHLRPTDCGVNSTRGNKDFDNGGSPVSAAPGCYTDTDSFEPRDAVKGDCARMIFYMAVRYEGDDGSMPDLRIVNQTGTSGATLGKLTTLLQWSIDDLVDDRERHRNERIYVQWQHNRNPFIDYPEAVELIWGTPASFTTY